MSILSTERLSDSPLVETITQGRTLGDGSATRPAECCWHMVFVTQESRTQLLIVGPWTTSGVASWKEGAEILWVKFRLGACMPHLPLESFRDAETPLPEATDRSFWLRGAAWEYPDFENIDTFLDRLARRGMLVRDPVVTAALRNETPDTPSRTLRHRFLQATGLSRNHIRQVERAQRAVSLLKAGVPIADTVYEAGYFDQPHMNRALKRFLGQTPTQILRSNAVE